jgi:hypothetical protein
MPGVASWASGNNGIWRLGFKLRQRVYEVAGGMNMNFGRYRRESTGRLLNAENAKKNTCC